MKNKNDSNNSEIDVEKEKDNDYCQQNEEDTKLAESDAITNKKSLDKINEKKLNNLKHPKIINRRKVNESSFKVDYLPSKPLKKINLGGAPSNDGNFSQNATGDKTSSWNSTLTGLDLTKDVNELINYDFPGSQESTISMREESTLTENKPSKSKDNPSDAKINEDDLQPKSNFMIKIARSGKEDHAWKSGNSTQSIFSEEQKEEIKKNSYFKKIFYELGQIKIEKVTVQRLKNGYVLIWKRKEEEGSEICSIYYKIEERFGGTVSDILYLINRDGFLELRITFD